MGYELPATIAYVEWLPEAHNPFAGFGGFLSRSIRENDYLWGRLHAVDRLFDILASTVPTNMRGDFDVGALKKRAFERVLEEEAGRLKFVPELLAQLGEVVARL